MTPRPLSRRDLLRYLAYGTAGLAVAPSLVACSDRSPSSSPAGGADRLRGPDDGRLLVVVELGGGNDSLSTLVPFESGTYRDLRPTLALGADDVIDLGDGWGLNKRLADLHQRDVAVINGVGTATPDLSHFAMLDRWWKGYLDGVPGDQVNAVRTGWLGRLCDELPDDAHFAGVSLQVGSAPVLAAAGNSTTSVARPSASALDDNRDRAELLRAAMEDLLAGTEAELERSRTGTQGALWIMDLLDELPEPSSGYPDTMFGTQMAAASRLARAGSGPRVIHVPQTQTEYDTHAKHAETHPRLMTELNDGLEAFLAEMDQVGLADNILVATTSEFGRRVPENKDGLDHGAASLMMMLGPVNGGVHGEHSSLTDLDGYDNLKASLPFDRYLATMAAWMGVDPGTVLPSDAAPLDGIVQA